MKLKGSIIVIVLYIFFNIPTFCLAQSADAKQENGIMAEFKNDTEKLNIEKKNVDGTVIRVEIIRKKVNLINSELLDYMNYKEYESKKEAKYMIVSISVCYGDECSDLSIGNFYFMSDPESVSVELEKKHNYKIIIEGGYFLKNSYSAIFYFNKDMLTKMEKYDAECEKPVWQIIYNLCEIG